MLYVQGVAIFFFHVMRNDKVYLLYYRCIVLIALNSLSVYLIFAVFFKVKAKLGPKFSLAFRKIAQQRKLYEPTVSVTLHQHNYMPIAI